MSPMKKAGLQLLVSPHVKTRAQALALVRNESQAEILRAALEGDGLTGLERQHEQSVRRLGARVEALGFEQGAAYDLMLKSRLTYSWIMSTTDRTVKAELKRAET